MEKETTIKWEDSRDELYTYFGKCSECEGNSVSEGSNFCNGCGKKINNRFREEPTNPLKQ